MFFSIVLVILGFLVLVYGGDRVCCGASAIAVRLRISQFIIGMTIVSISTSAPELITSLVAAWDNHQELVLSNIIGSNLANIGLAGGLVALIKPFDIPFRLPEISIFALISCVLSVVIITTKITAQEANFLFLLNFLYLLYVYRLDRRVRCFREDKALKKMADEIYLSGALGTFFWGILLLLIGAKVVIHCSLAIASEMGWTDSFVGFTIIAIGTSFPEIVTSLIASFRGYGSICIGNIIGSNIFNILFIVGASAYVCPLSITDSLRLFAIPFFVILTTLLSFLLATRRSIDRFFGFILFTLYLLSFHYMVR